MAGMIEYMNPGAGKPGYMSSWTFNMQRELPGQFLLDIGYIGQAAPICRPGWRI